MVGVVARVADAGRVQARVQHTLRIREAAQIVGAQRGGIAQQFLAGFRVAEAVAAGEREVAFVRGQQLDRQHLAARSGQAFRQGGHRIIEPVAQHQHQVAGTDAFEHEAQPFLCGKRPVGMQAVQREQQLVALAHSVAGCHEPHAIAVQHEQTEAVALAQGQFGDAGREAARGIETRAARAIALRHRRGRVQHDPHR